MTSLDGGGISNGPEANTSESVMEEDYCLHGRERFQHQWSRTGVFAPASLRVYGVTGEPVLVRAIKQARMLNANVGTCFLGRFQPPTAPTATAPPPASSTSASPTAMNGQPRGVAAAANANDSPSAAAAAAAASTTTTAYDALPFHSLLLGPLPPPEMLNDARALEAVWRKEVSGTWGALHMPSEWSDRIDGVVTESSWSTRAQRRRITEQLELAAFMCLRAVQVPLPYYAAADPGWSGGEDEEDAGAGGATAAAAISVAVENERNIRIACLAADALLAFIQQSPRSKVWVRCDACNPAHRYQLQRLRQAVLYGYSKTKTATNAALYRIHTPRSVTGCTTSASVSTAPAGARPGVVHTEAATSLAALLFFSKWHPRMLLPSEWFGEDVVGFECPTAPALLACLAPHGVAPHEHPHYRAHAAGDYSQSTPLPGSAAAAVAARRASRRTLAEEDDVEGEEADAFDEDENWDVDAFHDAHNNRNGRPAAPSPLEEGEGSEESNTAYSICDWYDTMADSQPQSPGRGASSAAAAAAAGALGSIGGGGGPHAHDGAVMSGSEESAADCRRSAVLRGRYVYAKPEDLQPMVAARWAGCYVPYVSPITFLVELLRRRALPIFDRGFFDQYPLLNYLHFKWVEEPTRDVFASYEGQLQLPLQPLSHHLSSGIYEVFERDAPKYSQYREAVFQYVRDWYAAGPEQQHCWQNKTFFGKHGVVQRVPLPSADERTLHLVLLGCGRGPLIDECLNAVSALGVRLRIFAIEKNRPAATFTRMRWVSEPEWTQLAHTFGHTLEVLVADGRTIATDAAAGALTLPPDFGLCDLVLSELLGSFGDNELSPECLEAFHAQLEQVQHRRGISPNPHLTCIPQQYTAWVAPVMSSSFEAAVMEAAAKGLTVPPPGCPDHHAALDHTLLVTNICRGVALAAPQPCWVFEHRFGSAPPRPGPPSGTGASLHCERDRGTAERRPSVSLERSAHLTFAAPPCGRCSGLVGYFSAVLYQSGSAAPTVISTAPADRTSDMYSWFPCVLALEPAQRAELHEVEQAAAQQSGTVAIHVQLDRKVDMAQRKVWYEWSVAYGDAAAPAGAEAASPACGASADTVVHNRNGWAAAMEL